MRYVLPSEEDCELRELAVVVPVNQLHRLLQEPLQQGVGCESAIVGECHAQEQFDTQFHAFDFLEGGEAAVQGVQTVLDQILTLRDCHVALEYHQQHIEHKGILVANWMDDSIDSPLRKLSEILPAGVHGVLAGCLAGLDKQVSTEKFSGVNYVLVVEVLFLLAPGYVVTY